MVDTTPPPLPTTSITTVTTTTVTDGKDRHNRGVSLKDLGCIGLLYG